MKDRVLRDFTQDDLNKVTETFHNWQITGRHSREGGNPENEANVYEDIAVFSKSVELEDLQKHDYVLTPGRYVGAVAEEDDGEPFAEKMPRGDKDAIMGWICVQPTIEVKKAFSKFSENFYKIIDNTTRENRNLEYARDTLLPKLFSGESRKVKGELQLGKTACQ